MDDLDRSSRRQLPIRGETRRLNRNVVGISGDLEIPLRDCLENRGNLRERLLARRFDVDPSRIEKHVVRELQHHATVPKDHLELTRIDHLVELQRQLAKERRSLLGSGLRFAQLLEARFCVVQRARQRAFFSEERVGIFSESRELVAQLLILRGRIVELRLQIVVGRHRIGKCTITLGGVSLSVLDARVQLVDLRVQRTQVCGASLGVFVRSVCVVQRRVVFSRWNARTEGQHGEHGQSA